MSHDLSDVTFRDRVHIAAPRRDATGLFWIGVAIFLGTVAIYPFYAYEVQKRLMARDVIDAAHEIGAQVDAFTEELSRESAKTAQRRTEAEKQHRLRGVSLAGSTIVNGQRVVIVDLGKATFAEARPTICRLAERRFGASFAGERVRVQLHRGRAPAVEAGVIRCGAQ